MTRRIHIPSLRPGRIALPEAQAHHLRDVLRLAIGSGIELFDDVGNIASAKLVDLQPEVFVEVGPIAPAPLPALQCHIAAAIPKGSRADWMIEKLSELGTARFIPLITARSIVLAGGPAKRERWARIAAEAAEQSRRVGVMHIEPPTKFADAIAQCPNGRALHLSTAPDAIRILSAIERVGDAIFPPLPRDSRGEGRGEGARPHTGGSRFTIALFIGPEGGWTADEITAFSATGLTGVTLGPTILRVETAAVAAAAIVQAAAPPPARRRVIGEA